MERLGAECAEKNSQGTTETTREVLYVVVIGDIVVVETFRGTRVDDSMLRKTDIIVNKRDGVTDYLPEAKQTM